MSKQTSNVRFWKEAGEVVAFIPIKFKRRNGTRKIITPGQTNTANTALVEAVAKAFHWQHLLETGKYANVSDLAQANCVDRTYIGKLLPLANLSPQIVKLILEGDEPDGLSLQMLRKGVPQSWREQQDLWG